MDDNAVQRTKCEEGATEQDSGIWLCSSMQGYCAAVLNRKAESTCWGTSLFFMNGVQTKKYTNLCDLDRTFMACKVSPTFALSHTKLVGLARCQGEHKERFLSLSLRLSTTKKKKVILISSAKGCSDTRELLGCCGSANWHMLSEVWYSRKGFLARKRGLVL